MLLCSLLSDFARFIVSLYRSFFNLVPARRFILLLVLADRMLVHRIAAIALCFRRLLVLINCTIHLRLFCNARPAAPDR